MTDSRTAQLRAWAALDDVVMENYGTDVAVDARRCANSIIASLGELTDADLLVIDACRKAYIAERAA